MPSPLGNPRPDSTITGRLLGRAAAGDSSAIDELLTRHRAALLEFVELHLFPTVRGRIDSSDVVQEAQADMARRLNDFLAHQAMPFHLWARQITYDRLRDLHRRHVRQASRSVGREQALPDQSSLLLAKPFLSSGPSPSQEAESRELAEQVKRALAGLPEADREMLLLRNVDGLPFAEIGSLLGIDPAAARKRFGRAVLRLRNILAKAGLLRGGS